MFRTLSDDEKAILADWHKHPGAKIARRELIARRDAEALALGKALLADPGSYDAIKTAQAAGEYRFQLRELNLGAFTAKNLERKETEPDE